MDNFKKFYNADKTPNTSGHMHSTARMTEMGDRKHLNFVPASASKRKDISISASQVNGRKVISSKKAQQIADKHGFDLKNLPKQLNSKWSTKLCFDSKNNQYYLSEKD